jgi:NitT/TauT family transport system substrate-binding protein
MLAFIRIAALAAVAAFALPAAAADVVRLGNLKFAHYGAVSYVKEIAPKYGLQVEERFFAKGLDIMPAILAGEIDVGASALDAAVAGRSRGVPIFAVAGFAKGGARLLVGKSAAISSVAGLKGRKVGVTRGGAQHLLLLAVLAQHGLTWSELPGQDVQLIYLAYADLNQALMANQVDAICQSEPQASQAINLGFGTELLKPYDTVLGEPERALVVSEKLYDQRHDVARRFMFAFVEATEKFIRDPAFAENYVRTVMFKNQITAQDFRDAIGNSPYSYDLSIDHVQATTDLMRQFSMGGLRQNLDAKEWVRLDLLQTAKSALGVM